MGIWKVYKPRVPKREIILLRNSYSELVAEWEVEVQMAES